MRGCGQESQRCGLGKTEPLSGFAVGICIQTETITRTCRALNLDSREMHYKPLGNAKALTPDKEG
jgi:hypothetical protein